MKNAPAGFGFNDASELEPTSEFDWAGVERNVFGPPPTGDAIGLSQNEIDAICAFNRRILQWQFQDGMRNPDGLKIRAIILCWIFLPQLKQLTLTEMSGAFGLHKQSLGRWVDDFKKHFPGIRTPHMRGPKP